MLNEKEESDKITDLQQENEVKNKNLKNNKPNDKKQNIYKDLELFFHI